MLLQHNKTYNVKPQVGAQIIPGHPLANGMILGYLFNEKGIDGTNPPIYDVSLNKRDTILTNGAFVADGGETSANNEALCFLADASWQQPAKMTIVVEMKKTTAWADYASLVSKIDNGTWADGYWLHWVGGAMRFAVGGYTKYASIAYTATGIFSQFVGIYDGTQARVLIDGVEGTPFTTSAVASNDSLAVGAFSQYNNPAYGVYKYVYIYDRVLTISEILSLKANPYQMYQMHRSPALYQYAAAGGETITVDKWFKELLGPTPHKIGVINY